MKKRLTRVKKAPTSVSLLFSGLGALAIALCSSASYAQTKVVGYVPAWKNMAAVVDATDLSKLTHINLSFLNPNGSGVVANNGNPVCMDGVTAANISYVVQKAHQAGVKVLVSLAGGAVPSCSGNREL